MLIGAMNHPANDAIDEIAWMADMGLDFIDMTLEPPASASWRADTRAIGAALQRFRMEVVGHTAFYLPLASPIEEVRRGAVLELRRCLQAFSEIGARWMNVHPDRNAPMHDRTFFIRQNIVSITDLLPDAERYGVGLMIENLPGEYNTPAQLSDLLDPIPELGLHLDIGHANLLTPYNMTEDILQRHGSRLRHVHLHDNKGGSADLHLPLGAGNIDVAAAVRALQACRYDATITLEVFTPDRHYLAYSRDVLQRVWEEALAVRHAPASTR
ncbi:MAG: sugar phosphate isomerase/epimerase [Acidobacteria bacterium]|nr:sugar phosphate isomerase/epimerase [Acidobacteriota bacterium]MBI3279622.1 sugar phosphate isomerase/epimerase [Acidobacteriota bacterium]